jgi:hypothetical protein
MKLSALSTLLTIDNPSRVPCDPLVVRFIRTIPKSAEAVQAPVVRTGIVVNVTGVHRRQLEGIICDRSEPPETRVARPRSSGEGSATVEIMRRAGKSKLVAWPMEAPFIGKQTLESIH